MLSRSRRFWHRRRAVIDLEFQGSLEIPASHLTFRGLAGAPRLRLRRGLVTHPLTSLKDFIMSDATAPKLKVCARPGCHHPLSLHKSGTSHCHALGCHAGEKGAPCPEFVGATEEPDSST